MHRSKKLLPETEVFGTLLGINKRRMLPHVIGSSAPDGNALPIPKEDADKAMDAAQYIGCGACVAACKNASAMLFVGAKVSHLALLPQGQVERERRVLNMVAQMDAEGFGNCTNTGSCEAACPKGITLGNIGRMNREYWRALFKSKLA